MKYIPVLLIGGVGRSGTNVLKYVFETNSSVYSLPFESRFTIDPDGVIPTYSLLKETWSPFVSEKGIERLSIFLNRVSNKSLLDKFAEILSKLFFRFGLDGNIKAYKEWELEKSFPNFRAHNLNLINKISLLYYKGTWAGRKGSLSKNALNSLSYSYYNNYLDTVFNDYLYKLYIDLLKSNNKHFYVEDNTFNILYAHHYQQLLPDGLLINMIRDPRDTIASYIHQRWCPKNIKKAVKYYIEIMERWWVIKDKLNQKFYMEIKLEDLCKNTKKTLEQIFERLPIDFEKQMLHYDLSKSNSGRWKSEFNEDEKKFLNEKLEKYINYYNY